MRNTNRLIAALLAGSVHCGVQSRQAVTPNSAPSATGRHAGTGAADAAPSARKDRPDGGRTAAAASPTGTGGSGEDIVVNGSHPRGSVIGTIPPERTLDSRAIQAYGADDVEALLNAIAPQVSSNRGATDDGPVTLLNGRRVSDLAEIARIPTEAIVRVEVFPEELALEYGYRADQKVVNIVTRQRYRRSIGQLAGSATTEGGRSGGTARADYLALHGDGRASIGATYGRTEGLRESGGGPALPDGTGGSRGTRTLLPSIEQARIEAVLGTSLPNEVSASVNGSLEANRSRSLLEADGSGPLRRVGDKWTAHLGSTLGGSSGRWLWNATGNYDRARTSTTTALVSPGGGSDHASTIDARSGLDLLLAGPLADLPAGPLGTSLSASVDFRDFESRSSRAGSDAPTAYSRDRVAAQVSVDLPLLRGRGPLAAVLGTVTANANLELARLSDAGGTRTFGYGLHWSPSSALDVIASVTDAENAPTLEQLGAPLLVTPGVRTFDLATASTSDVTLVTGGDPGLRREDRRVLKLGVSARPLPGTDLNLSLQYVASRVHDQIAAFPSLTPQIEAAFPDRVTRDGDGRLLRIDGRPVNFADAHQRQLRWGFNYTRSLAPPAPGGTRDGTRFFDSVDAVKRAMPNAVFHFEPAGSPMSQAAGDATSRLFLSLYHSWALRDEAVPRRGLPTIDLLGGDAVDLVGGRRRHQIDADAGAFRRGLGARISGRWRSGAVARGADGGELRIEGLATVDLNLFANVEQRFGAEGRRAWLRGVRASLGVSNLFDARPVIRDGSGDAPVGYRPSLLDPLGRVFSFSLRKAF